MFKFNNFLLGLGGSMVFFAMQIPLQAQRAGNQPPQFISPEVGADHRVSFRIHAPNASEVRLASSGDIPGISFNQPKVLTKGENGVWEVTLDPLQGGAYRYSFNVDGVTVLDPRNPNTSQSNDNSWSLFDVPGISWMEAKNVPHGSISEVNYWSTSLNRLRRLHVYTPPGYETSSDRYPVFYLLHGAFDSDDSWSTVGRAGWILDNLIQEGKAKPMIVIMPHGHTGPFRFGGSMSGDFEKDFVQDIQPQMEKRYRILPGRENRALAGLSMGGAHTLNIGIPHLDQFAYLGVYSSGIFGITGGPGGGQRNGPSFEEQHKSILDNADLKRGLKWFWFATGKDDFLVETSRATVAMFRKHGFEVDYKETDGGHTWDKWREYMHEFAPRLFQP